MGKDDVFMEKDKKILILILFVVLVVGLVGSFFVMKKKDMEKQTLVSEDVSEKKDDSGEKKEIYDRISDGKVSAENKIKALEKDPYLGIEKEVFQKAWQYIRAYEERESSLLKGMLSEGVAFDFDSYFKKQKKDIQVPLVRIQGFYEYETETACVCEVTGRMKAENGEEVYDLENTYRMTFAVLPDGSIMPYSDNAGRMGDPYLIYGLGEGK